MKELAKGETVSQSRGCEDILLPKYHTYDEFAAVRFQFTRVGSDPGAAELLESLDQDREIGEYIDVLPVEFNPKGEFPEKWFVVCQNLLFSKFINQKWKHH